MFRCLLWIVLTAVPVLAEPIAVTLSGNFGGSNGPGSSILDNQNYTLSFVIPDQSFPSATMCCEGRISATYYGVNAQLVVPGIGFSLNTTVTVQYNSESPSGDSLFIFIGQGGLPRGDFLILNPFQLNSGDLWNGLVGPLGTPMITILDNAPGSGRWYLVPIAIYAGPMAVTAAAVPEPASIWLMAGALAAWGVLRIMRAT